MQTVITLCDVCDDEATRGEPVVVALGRDAPPKVVDLCDSHTFDLVGPLRSVLDEHGRRLPEAEAAPPAPSGRGDTYPCIICDFASVSVAALSQHIRNRHRLSTVAEVYGESPSCMVCGQAFDSARALAGHARLHGEEGAHGLFRAALRAGDPHDLIAKRKAELGVIQR